MSLDITKIENILKIHKEHKLSQLRSVILILKLPDLCKYLTFKFFFNK